MKIAAWNVNSLTVRLPHIIQWLQTEKPDILALQEIKMETQKFPEEIFSNMGYYTAVSGQKTYNGVAILSLQPLIEIETPVLLKEDTQKRIISVSTSISNSTLRIINTYIPNGEAVGSLKYDYKLNFLSALKKYLMTQLKSYKNIIILGDFNIAPSDEDVHDPLLWKEKILCSTPERQAFQDILDAGFTDSFRLFPQPPNTFSWWDYRSVAFRRNAGLRIDHILLSTSLKLLCQASYIDKTPRSQERPSDHAPVVMIF